jgi:uncharacterized protein (DUF1330 family)
MDQRIGRKRNCERATTIFKKQHDEGEKVPVYMVIEIEVLNEGLYSEYAERVPEVIEKYGGKYLVRGGRITSLSEDWNPERIVIIEFEDVESCRACFRSEEYREIAHLREGARPPSRIRPWGTSLRW